MPPWLAGKGSDVVLAFIAVTLVVGLLKLLERRSTREDPEQRVTNSLAYIEREGIEMPVNWRAYIEERIKHGRRSERMLIGVVRQLLKDGHHVELAALLEHLERET